MSDRPLRTQYLHNAMTGWRQGFHAHPELGFEEHRTATKVAQLLADFGLDVHRAIGGTGVVGVLQRGEAARPGCFILMGNGTRGAHGRPLHSADYDFNDEVLTIGSSFWVQLVEQQLRPTGSTSD